MSEVEAQPSQTPMTLRKALGIYLALLFALLLLGRLAGALTWFPGFLVFIAYLAFGFVLNRQVLRALVEWHPAYNTIQNVARGKLRALLLWPVAYPMLFFKLGVIKHL